jgi:hypothetical protein
MQVKITSKQLRSFGLNVGGIFFGDRLVASIPLQREPARAMFVIIVENSGLWHVEESCGAVNKKVHQTRPTEM